MTRIRAHLWVRKLLGIRDVRTATLQREVERSAHGVPDRAELVWKEVVLELHPWARRGPTRGVFLGQGERGLSIRVEGGGRFVYTHAEVRSVRTRAARPSRKRDTLD